MAFNDSAKLWVFLIVTAVVCAVAGAILLGVEKPALRTRLVGPAVQNPVDTRGKKSAEGVGQSLSSWDQEILQSIRAQIGVIADELRASAPLSPRPPMQQIAEMLEGPEEKIDLTLAEFLLASEIPEFKDIDVTWEIARVEWLASYVRFLVRQHAPRFRADPRLFGGNEKEFLIRMMVMALNGRDLLQIDYVNGNPDPADPRQLFVNGLLDTRRGTCISMHVVYILTAERLGWPIHGVTVKDHLFCRWDDGVFRSNIEGTARGASGGDSEYVKDFGVSAAELRRTVYMKTLTKRQMLAQLLFHRSMYWVSTGRPEKAIEDLQLAVKAPGVDPYMHRNLSRLKSGKTGTGAFRDDAAGGRKPRQWPVPDPAGTARHPVPPLTGMPEAPDASLAGDPLHYLEQNLCRDLPSGMPHSSGLPALSSPGAQRHPALDDPLYYNR